MHEMMNYGNWQNFADITDKQKMLMGIGMGVWIVAWFAAGIAIDVFISRLMTEIAVQKGYADCRKKIFWINFFLPVCGWIYVMALPEKKPA